MTRRRVAVGLVALLLLVWAYDYFWLTRARTPTHLGTAPAFDLPDQSGNRVTLDQLLAEGPALVVFYRGYW